MNNNTKKYRDNSLLYTVKFSRKNIFTKMYVFLTSVNFSFTNYIADTCIVCRDCSAVHFYLVSVVLELDMYMSFFKRVSISPENPNISNKHDILNPKPWKPNVLISH